MGSTFSITKTDLFGINKDIQDIKDLVDRFNEKVQFIEKCNEKIEKRIKQLEDSKKLTGRIDIEYIDALAHANNSEVYKAFDSYFCDRCTANCVLLNEYIDLIKKKGVAMRYLFGKRDIIDCCFHISDPKEPYVSNALISNKKALEIHKTALTEEKERVLALIEDKNEEHALLQLHDKLQKDILKDVADGKIERSKLVDHRIKRIREIPEFRSFRIDCQGRIPMSEILKS